MSSSSRPKPGCFGSDIHRLLEAAEAGQKADILTYSSGHLGAHSLDQTQPHREKKQFFWRTSQHQEESSKPLTLQKRQTKVRAYIKKKEMKESSSEFTFAPELVESGILGSRQDQAPDHSSHADRTEDISPPCFSNSLPVQLEACSQKNSSSEPEGINPFCATHSDQKHLNNEDQVGLEQWLGRRGIANQGLWAGINVAEKHERKLQKELKKLSVQSWPSRERLAVFSDVFDDVCEGSPVFGHILREIKTEYDLYVNHLMVSHSSQGDMNPLHKDLGNGKVTEMEMEKAEKEVFRLEQEARRALEEKRRLQNELQNIPAVNALVDSDKTVLQDRGTDISCNNTIQLRRLQVLSVWKEVQELEEEIKEKFVSTVTTTATERRIKAEKTDVMKLIASNERLRTVCKDLENKINEVLNREKVSKAMRRMLWNEIHCDQQPETE